MEKIVDSQQIEKLCSKMPVKALFWQWARRLSGDQNYYRLLEKAAYLHDAKNRGYAGGHDPLFNLIITEFLKVGFPCPHCGKECIVPGEVAIMIRKLDKVIRDINLTRTGVNPLEDESVIDTEMDEANYSLLEAAYRERKKREASKVKMPAPK